MGRQDWLGMSVKNPDLILSPCPQFDLFVSLASGQGDKLRPGRQTGAGRQTKAGRQTEARETNEAN